MNKVDVITVQLINAAMDRAPVSGPRYPGCPISTGGDVYAAGQGNEVCSPLLKVYLQLLHRQAQNEGYLRGTSDLNGRTPPSQKQVSSTLGKALRNSITFSPKKVVGR